MSDLRILEIQNCSCVPKLWCCVDPKAQIPTLLWGLFVCLFRKEGQSFRWGVSQDLVPLGARPLLCPDRPLVT